MTIRNQPDLNGFPSPAEYELGSPESRAAARAMADAKRGHPKIVLIGERARDGRLIYICIYDGGHMVENEG